MALADDINIRKDGMAGRITLTRPQALNALTYDMALAIEQALDGWESDADVRLIIIDAEGHRAFCSGGDIQQLYDTGKAGDFEYGRKFWADEYRLNAKIANFPKPYVAVMDGIVMGGGVGISAHGSHRIVTENTLFAMPECGIGLVPDVGGCFILSRAPGHLGEYLGTTGARAKAADTIYAGFADTHVPAANIPALIEALSKTGDPASIDAYAEKPEPGELDQHQDQIDRHFSDASISRIVQSLEAGETDRSAQQAKLLRRGCPLSVACALDLVKLSRGLNRIEDVLALEYRFTFRSMSHGEFIEGIRAQIIDKDRNPNWETKTLEAVTKTQVDQMLAPLGDRELAL